MITDDFNKIFRACFRDDPARADWFLRTVAADPTELRVGSGPEGRPATALMMQPYAFMYQGTTLPSSYISCVATMPEARGKGLAGELLDASLRDMCDAGVVLATLIPAQDHLYFFYGKRDFATTFYADEDRYTALHKFKDGYGEPVEPGAEILAGLEERIGCGVLHTAADFAEIVKDLSFEPGASILARRGDDGEAILFACADEREATVKCLMADSAGLAESLLADLRRQVGDKPITVWTPPHDGSRDHLRSRGMMRIVNARAVLAALAAAHPHLHLSIELHDGLIEANTGTFVIDKGTVEKVPDGSIRKPDLQVGIRVLASILFSSSKIGNIFEVPSRRPYMAMMLD